MPDTKSNQPENPTHPEEELDMLKSRLNGLEELLAQKEQELALKDSRISELEQALAPKESEITGLKQSLVEFNYTIDGLKTALKEAAESYKAQVLAANPDVPEELISGGEHRGIEHLACLSQRAGLQSEAGY